MKVHVRIKSTPNQGKIPGISYPRIFYLIPSQYVRHRSIPEKLNMHILILIRIYNYQWSLDENVCCDCSRKSCPSCSSTACNLNKENKNSKALLTSAASPSTSTFFYRRSSGNGNVSRNVLRKRNYQPRSCEEVINMQLSGPTNHK